MSKLAEFKALEAQLAAQLAQLDALKQDDELKREIEFEQKLRALLAEHGFSLRDVIAILDPKAVRTVAPAQSSGRKARAVKRYKNPNTGEVVETKGGNHRVLKEWKAEFGSDAVESWLQ
jgi:hypothetical protein